MRRIDALLAEYGESHQHPVNEAVHWICVPLIAWSVVALLWSLPFPWGIGSGIVPLNWAVVALALAQVYYFRLSRRLGMGLMLLSLSLLWLTAEVADHAPWPLWQVGIAVFLLAWVGQFVGPLVEGNGPSFFKDLQFLLVGPAWLLAFVYRRAGLPF